MVMEHNKKMSIVCILEILREYSDENHHLTQQDIIDKLTHHYGITLDRKSVSSNLDSLVDFGYDIIRDSRGCYLGSRELEPSEVSFLIDAVFSSKSIDSRHSQELAEKLSKFLSEHQRKKYKYIVKADDVVRTDNKQLFYTIDVINEAIEKNKQVELHYNRFYLDQEQNNKKKSMTRVINPYFMVNNQGRYFLVCNYDKFNDLANYKLELISDVKILDTDIRPITELVGCTNGVDQVKYANENIYMFHNQPVDATLKIHNEYAVNYIVDWFGGKTKFTEKDGSVYAYVRANEDALVYWCLQYGQDIELVEPQSTRERIKQALTAINTRYGN